MKIYSLSKILAFPIAIIAIYIGYILFFTYDNVSWYLVFIPVMLGMLLYLFHPQIDHWYLKRNPLPLEDSIKTWLLQYDPYYAALDSESKAKFEHRLNLYVHGRAFQAVVMDGYEELPYDLSCFIAAQAVKMTMNRSDYLMGDMDRIFVYAHPFPSPRYKFLHTTETQVEDGVLLMALDHMIPGFTKPDQFYNIGVHTYAEAYTKVYTDIDWPEEDWMSWGELESISGFKKEQILGVLGYETVDLLLIYITYYFTFPEKLSEKNPELYKRLNHIFRLAEHG